MKKLDAQTYNLSIFRRRFTQFDEVLASAISPMNYRKVNATVDTLRHCVDAVLYGEKAPERWHWVEIVDAVNLIETFIREGYIDDPDGLHCDLHKSMVSAGTRFLSGKVSQLRFDAKGAAALAEFVDGFADMLRELPERKVVRAHRLTIERMERVLAGGVAEDAVVQELL